VALGADGHVDDVAKNLVVGTVGLAKTQIGIEREVPILPGGAGAVMYVWWCSRNDNRRGYKKRGADVNKS
jgi:hypothetical protein